MVQSLNVFGWRMMMITMVFSWDSKAGLSLAIFRKKIKNYKFEFKVKLWWLVGEKQFLGLFRSNEGLE